MYKPEQPQLGYLVNQVKHALDFGPIAARRMNRAEWLLSESHINLYIETNGTYIDIGEGKGYVSMLLENQNRHKNIKVFGLDALDYPTKRVRRELPSQFMFANGKSSPFPSGLFDGAFLLFVLHHEDDQIALLNEAGRIVRPGGYIFVAEDTPNTGSERRTTLRADTRFNSSLWKNEPHNYRSTPEWEEIFQNMRYILVQENNFSSSSVNHTFFVLQTPKIGNINN